MNDVYPPVAITTSAVGYRQPGNKLAGEKLKMFCSNESTVYHFTDTIISFLLPMN